MRLTRCFMWDNRAGLAGLLPQAAFFVLEPATARARVVAADLAWHCSFAGTRRRHEPGYLAVMLAKVGRAEEIPVLVLRHEDEIPALLHCEKGAPSGQLEIKTPLYLPCPSWATGETTARRDRDQRARHMEDFLARAALAARMKVSPQSIAAPKWPNVAEPHQMFQLGHERQNSH
jgi:hypothetical protein